MFVCYSSRYDKWLWRSFIITYFKISSADDLKFFGKFGIKFIPISLIGIIITVALNPKRAEYPLVCVFIPFGIFLIYFLWVMGRNILKALDHLIFSDCKVILMKSGAIFNGEYINWHYSINQRFYNYLKVLLILYNSFRGAVKIYSLGVE